MSSPIHWYCPEWTARMLGINKVDSSTMTEFDNGSLLYDHVAAVKDKHEIVASLPSHQVETFGIALV